ncbi:MAG: hypothetical protein COW02_18295 [Comamonadaceae bacterium CG12_big_fil_rev_8_21_14_0_65_59_15]|nr:MAG: hypothetical protein COW02_18295 [Comamonadaceae bacterium CG12_big_fil_rev_8_21_14_0_65_59_15]
MVLPIRIKPGIGRRNCWWIIMDTKRLNIQPLRAWLTQASLLGLEFIPYQSTMMCTDQTSSLQCSIKRKQRNTSVFMPDMVR